MKFAGLGVRNFIKFNQALMGKWLWRYATKQKALRRKLVKIKYDRHMGDWCSKEVGGTYGVGVWKCIQREWEGFAQNLWHDIGDITKVLFWREVWCGECPLKLV